MGRFRVFLGAPTVAELRSETTGTYTWQTVSAPRAGSEQPAEPSATNEAVSRRLTTLYENITFSTRADNEGPDDEDTSNVLDQTTMITWPPTPTEDLSDDLSHAESREDATFLRSIHGVSRIHSEFQTQDTQDTTSYDYSDASSIARFPAFHFNLNNITSLQSLTSKAKQQPCAVKANILAAVLEVEGPDTIRLKRGADAGKEVSILKLVVGDDGGTVCRLTAWREVADTWGGNHDEPCLKRGDIIHFENVLTTKDPSGPDSSTFSPVTLTASPNLRSKMEICFRTMPNSTGDAQFRPDLRLGFSDTAVRKVASVVTWFEKMAGLLKN